MIASDPTTAPRATNWRRKLPSGRAALLLWLPATLVALAILLPCVYLLIRALGAENAGALLTRATTWQTAGRTLLLAGSVTACSALLAVPIAWLTTRTDLPRKGLWATLTALPIVIPSYVGAYLLVSAVGPRGILQGWLEPLGVERLPSMYGFPGALYLLTILCYPYILLGVRAAMLRLDPAQEEAAQSMGMGPWATFWRVQLPQLQPAIFSGGLLVALYVIRDFGAVSILRYDTFTRVIYIQYRSTFDRAAAAVLALVLVAFTLVLLYLEQRTERRVQTYASAGNTQRRALLFRLGRWRWPAQVFLGAVVLAGLVLPAVNLLFWLVRGVLAGETIPELWLASWNSVLAAGLAAFGTTLAALPVAVVSVRYPNRISKLLERSSYMAFALPGIVVALALVFFGIRFALPLYQTLPMLLFAYGVLFLPEAVGAVRSALLQVHSSYEEAARSLGHGPLRVFRAITLPLVQPGLRAGAALVFLTAIKELPATLILAPIGFRTLSTGVWNAVTEAFFAQAAAPALLLILASSLPTAMIILQEQRKR